jgi:hypothetical protein
MNLNSIDEMCRNNFDTFFKSDINIRTEVLHCIYYAVYEEHVYSRCVEGCDPESFPYFIHIPGDLVFVGRKFCSSHIFDVVRSYDVPYQYVFNSNDFINDGRMSSLLISNCILDN